MVQRLEPLVERCCPSAGAALALFLTLLCYSTAAHAAVIDAVPGQAMKIEGVDATIRPESLSSFPSTHTLYVSRVVNGSFDLCPSTGSRWSIGLNAPRSIAFFNDTFNGFFNCAIRICRGDVSRLHIGTLDTLFVNCTIEVRDVTFHGPLQTQLASQAVFDLGYSPSNYYALVVHNPIVGSSVSIVNCTFSGFSLAMMQISGPATSDGANAVLHRLDPSVASALVQAALRDPPRFSVINNTFPNIVLPVMSMFRATAYLLNFRFLRAVNASGFTSKPMSPGAVTISGNRILASGILSTTSSCAVHGLGGPDTFTERLEVTDNLLDFTTICRVVLGFNVVGLNGYGTTVIRGNTIRLRNIAAASASPQVQALSVTSASASQVAPSALPAVVLIQNNTIHVTGSNAVGVVVIPLTQPTLDRLVIEHNNVSLSTMEQCFAVYLLGVAAATQSAANVTHTWVVHMNYFSMSMTSSTTGSGIFMTQRTKDEPTLDRVDVTNNTVFWDGGYAPGSGATFISSYGVHVDLQHFMWSTTTVTVSMNLINATRTTAFTGIKVGDSANTTVSSNVIKVAGSSLVSTGIIADNAGVLRGVTNGNSLDVSHNSVDLNMFATPSSNDWPTPARGVDIRSSSALRISIADNAIRVVELFQSSTAYIRLFGAGVRLQLTWPVTSYETTSNIVTPNLLGLDRNGEQLLRNITVRHNSISLTFDANFKGNAVFGIAFDSWIPAFGTFILEDNTISGLVTKTVTSSSQLRDTELVGIGLGPLSALQRLDPMSWSAFVIRANRVVLRSSGTATGLRLRINVTNATETAKGSNTLVVAENTVTLLAESDEIPIVVDRAHVGLQVVVTSSFLELREFNVTDNTLSVQVLARGPQGWGVSIAPRDLVPFTASLAVLRNTVRVWSLPRPAGQACMRNVYALGISVSSVSLGPEQRCLALNNTVSIEPTCTQWHFGLSLNPSGSLTGLPDGSPPSLEVRGNHLQLITNGEGKPPNFLFTSTLAISLSTGFRGSVVVADNFVNMTITSEGIKPDEDTSPRVGLDVRSGSRLPSLQLVNNSVSVLRQAPFGPGGRTEVIGLSIGRLIAGDVTVSRCSVTVSGDPRVPTATGGSAFGAQFSVIADRLTIVNSSFNATLAQTSSVGVPTADAFGIFIGPQQDPQTVVVIQNTYAEAHVIGYAASAIIVDACAVGNTLLVADVVANASLKNPSNATAAPAGAIHQSVATGFELRALSSCGVGHAAAALARVHVTVRAPLTMSDLTTSVFALGVHVPGQAKSTSLAMTDCVVDVGCVGVCLASGVEYHGLSRQNGIGILDTTVNVSHRLGGAALAERGTRFPRPRPTAIGIYVGSSSMGVSNVAERVAVNISCELLHCVGIDVSRAPWAVHSIAASSITVLGLLQNLTAAASRQGQLASAMKLLPRQSENSAAAPSGLYGIALNQSGTLGQFSAEGFGRGVVNNTFDIRLVETVFVELAGQTFAPSAVLSSAEWHKPLSLAAVLAKPDARETTTLGVNRKALVEDNLADIGFSLQAEDGRRVDVPSDDAIPAQLVSSSWSSGAPLLLDVSLVAFESLPTGVAGFDENAEEPFLMLRNNTLRAGVTRWSLRVGEHQWRARAQLLSAAAYVDSECTLGPLGDAFCGVRASAHLTNNRLSASIGRGGHRDSSAHAMSASLVAAGEWLPPFVLLNVTSSRNELVARPMGVTSMAVAVGAQVATAWAPGTPSAGATRLTYQSRCDEVDGTTVRLASDIVRASTPAGVSSGTLYTLGSTETVRLLGQQGEANGLLLLPCSLTPSLSVSHGTASRTPVATPPLTRTLSSSLTSRFGPTRSRSHSQSAATTTATGPSQSRSATVSGSTSPSHPASASLLRSVSETTTYILPRIAAVDARHRERDTIRFGGGWLAVNGRLGPAANTFPVTLVGGDAGTAGVTDVFETGRRCTAGVTLTEWLDLDEAWSAAIGADIVPGLEVMTATVEDVNATRYSGPDAALAAAVGDRVPSRVIPSLADAFGPNATAFDRVAWGMMRATQLPGSRARWQAAGERGEDAAATLAFTGALLQPTGPLTADLHFVPRFLPDGVSGGGSGDISNATRLQAAAELAALSGRAFRLRIVTADRCTSHYAGPLEVEMVVLFVQEPPPPSPPGKVDVSEPLVATASVAAGVGGAVGGASVATVPARTLAIAAYGRCEFDSVESSLAVRSEQDTSLYESGRGVEVEQNDGDTLAREPVPFFDAPLPLKVSGSFAVGAVAGNLIVMGVFAVVHILLARSWLGWRLRSGSGTSMQVASVPRWSARSLQLQLLAVGASLGRFPSLESVIFLYLLTPTVALSVGVLTAPTPVATVDNSGALDTFVCLLGLLIMTVLSVVAVIPTLGPIASFPSVFSLNSGTGESRVIERLVRRLPLGDIMMRALQSLLASGGDWRDRASARVEAAAALRMMRRRRTKRRKKDQHAPAVADHSSVVVPVPSATDAADDPIDDIAQERDEIGFSYTRSFGLVFIDYTAEGKSWIVMELFAAWGFGILDGLLRGGQCTSGQAWAIVCVLLVYCGMMVKARPFEATHNFAITFLLGALQAAASAFIAAAMSLRNNNAAESKSGAAVANLLYLCGEIALIAAAVLTVVRMVYDTMRASFRLLRGRLIRLLLRDRATRAAENGELTVAEDADDVLAPLTLLEAELPEALSVELVREAVGDAAAAEVASEVPITKDEAPLVHQLPAATSKSLPRDDQEYVATTGGNHNHDDGEQWTAAEPLLQVPTVAGASRERDGALDAPSPLVERSGPHHESLEEAVDGASPAGQAGSAVPSHQRRRRKSRRKSPPWESSPGRSDQLIAEAMMREQEMRAEEREVRRREALLAAVNSSGRNALLMQQRLRHHQLAAAGARPLADYEIL